MRIERVIPRLYCGGSMNTPELAHSVINGQGFTHVLDLHRYCDLDHIWDSKPEGRVEILHYHLKDDGTPRPRRFWISTITFGVEVMQQEDTRLFVHCAAGRNRSVSVCYGILRVMGHSVEEATELMLEYGKRLYRRDGNFRELKRVRYAPEIEDVLDDIRALIVH